MGIKEEVKEGAYRTAARQMILGIKRACVSALKDKGVEGSKIEAFSTFLDTEFGEAFISVILGYTLPHIPAIGNDARAIKLAEEFRIGGLSTAGNKAMNVGIEYFLGPLTKSFQLLESLPEENFRAEEDGVEEPKAAKAKTKVKTKK